MSLHLDFLNKNMSRKYPIRSDMTCLCEDGSYLPQGLLTSMQLTVEYTKSNLYISKIFVHDNFVSVTISDNDTGMSVGCFSGLVTKDFQSIPLTPYYESISGSMTVGMLSALPSFNGIKILTFETARIEESLLFIFTRPGINSIQKFVPTAIIPGGRFVVTETNLPITGMINLVGINVTITVDSPNITLSIVNTSTIKSLTDIGGAANNCLTPIITHLNDVTPDAEGNIDIYGILPLKVNMEAGKLDFENTELTIDDVCPERKKLAPPVNNLDTYYADILSIRTPEWRANWPEFNPP